MNTGFLIWITGLAGSGKTTIANECKKLYPHFVVLDGDELRNGLCKDLGFSAADRDENIRRVVSVAKLLYQNDITVLVALVSPMRHQRVNARAEFAAGDFFEIFVDTPLSVCEDRDPKGMYAKARTGQIKEFTGVSAIYEKPEHPELVIRTQECSPSGAVQFIIGMITKAHVATLGST